MGKNRIIGDVTLQERFNNDPVWFPFGVAIYG